MSRKREAKVFTNNQFHPFSAKNSKQKSLFNSLTTYDITFASGPAGVGKTAICASFGAQLLMEGKIDKILVTRPMVTTSEEEIGALPGTLDEKYMEFYAPVKDIFDEVLGASHAEMFKRDGKIQALPLAFMRGRTFNRTFMILDEAQNCVPAQMKAFLTRIGKESKIAICGDENQSDIKGKNGFTDAMRRLQNEAFISIVKFEREDFVRNSIISDILACYEGC